MDWNAYYDAAKKCHDLSNEISNAVTPVHSALFTYVGMCGNYDSVKPWSDDYDRHTKDLISGSANLVNALRKYGDVLAAQGYNWQLHDHKVNIDPNKGPAPTPPRPTGELTLTEPPSALGSNGDGIHNTGGPHVMIDGLINKLKELAVPIPNGDHEKIGAAGAAWKKFGESTEVAGAAAKIKTIISQIEAIHDPDHQADNLGHLDTLRQGANTIAQGSVALAEPVSAHSVALNDARSEMKTTIDHLKRDLLIGTVTIVVFSLALAPFTAGASVEGGVVAEGAGVAALIADAALAIRSTITGSTLLRAILLVGGVASAAKAFEKLPDLGTTISGLASIIAMRVLIDDHGDHPEIDEDAEEYNFEGTGFSRDEIAEFARGHAGDDNPAMGRPSIKEIEDALDHGTQSPGKGNSVRYDYNGVRVIVNRDMPIKSTTYYPSR